MADGKVRVDKWLWFARFAKSRSLAARLVGDGHVRLNGRRVEVAAKPVGIGDVLTVAAPHVTCVIRVVATGTRRGPPSEARTLYEAVGRDDGALATEEGEP